jgi:hypothetical protein
MANNSEEGQGSQRAVVPMMMMMMMMMVMMVMVVMVVMVMMMMMMMIFQCSTHCDSGICPDVVQI